MVLVVNEIGPAPGADSEVKQGPSQSSLVDRFKPVILAHVILPGDS